MYASDFNKPTWNWNAVVILLEYRPVSSTLFKVMLEFAVLRR